MEWSSPWASAPPSPLPADIKDETGGVFDTLARGTVWEESEGASAFESWTSNVDNRVSPQWHGRESVEQEGENEAYANNDSIAALQTRKELDDTCWHERPPASLETNAGIFTSSGDARNDLIPHASTNGGFNGSHTTSSEALGEPPSGKIWEEAAHKLAANEQTCVIQKNDEGSVTPVVSHPSVIFSKVPGSETKIYTAAELTTVSTLQTSGLDKTTVSSPADGEADEGVAIVSSKFGHSSDDLAAAADFTPVLPEIRQDEGVDTRNDSLCDVLVDFVRNPPSTSRFHAQQVQPDQSRLGRDDELQSLVFNLDDIVHATPPVSAPSVNAVEMDNFIKNFVSNTSAAGNESTAYDLTPPQFVSTALATSDIFPKPVEGESNTHIADRDLFMSTSQRKAWYLISRRGTLREYESNGVGSYVRVQWPCSAIQTRLLGIVTQWIADDRLGYGSANLNGHAKRFNAVNFKWAAATSSVQEDVPKLTKEQLSFVDSIVMALPDLSFMYIQPTGPRD